MPATDPFPPQPQEVTAVTALLPPADPAAGCFISATWLDGWANGESQPEPVDNSMLLCEHQQLNPAASPGSYKLISEAAWEQLVVSCCGW